ncbi:MAG: hypothetical protein HKN49_07745 [Gammaproteobacteria bacterium]|nr:hypothetical protein [Gammaproteobacteria bacterium]
MSIKPGLTDYLAYGHRKGVDGQLPIWRQLIEMVLLFVYRQNGPGYYMFGRFWRRDLPLRQKLKHSSERSYKRRINELNDPRYQKISQHKIAEKALLKLFSMPTPEFLGFLSVSGGRSATGAPLTTPQDLIDLLADRRPAAICFKPVEGTCGVGFQATAIRCGDDSTAQLRPLPNGDWQSVADFFNAYLQPAELATGYLVEEYLQQHPWYEQLNPDSVNTVRLYVIQSVSGQARVLGGYLRIGRVGSAVDNATLGGIFCPIDVHTGVIGPARFNTYDSDDFQRHPDSGLELAGATLPCWDEIMALANRLLHIFPHTRFAGVDIAVGNNGPCVIELNVEPDRTAACDIDLPTIDMLDDRWDQAPDID